MDNILRERRLRCLEHVLHMDHQRIPKQALYWPVTVNTTSANQPIYYIGDVSKLTIQPPPQPLVPGRWEEGKQVSRTDLFGMRVGV